jgi:transcriptional regulator with XRE-family HTH domain
MSEKINERLREARKSKGLHQKVMAEKLNISRAGYSRMETGKVEITTKNLAKIIEILDIPLDWLILGKEVDQTKPGLNFSDFGEYAGAVEIMFNDMKKDKEAMHNVLASFFESKGKEVKNEKEQEKDGLQQT